MQLQSSLSTSVNFGILLRRFSGMWTGVFVSPKAEIGHYLRQRGLVFTFRTERAQVVSER
jgi:hypothetical protein